MDFKFFTSVSAIVFLYSYFAAAKNGGRISIPTRFTCQGRVAGYYADIDTGCQVYHMCDGLGRQFSYSCPNTTLFQQRMLICDHWYMVNCSNSESDYDANLLIGQRDKPFVSDEDMRLRTPRPDILSVPPNSNYYDGLKEAESKFSLHQSNSIGDGDDDDSIPSANSNDLDNDRQNFKPITIGTNNGRKPPAFSSGESNSKPNTDAAFNVNKNDNVEEEASSSKTVNTFDNVTDTDVSPPSRDLTPPLLPPTTTEADDFEIDVRMKPTRSDPVFNFIKRFDPNSPDSLNTSMSKKDIIDLNKHLPDGQSSAEDDRTPRKNKNFGSNFNNVESDKKKGVTEESRFNTANVKTNTEAVDDSKTNVVTPSRELLPPKSEYSPIASTTMGPPIYFEWKWAVPAFDLEPPKEGNHTSYNTANKSTVKGVGKRPFNIPRSTTEAGELKTKNVEYNISSYFVPDYVFPLDSPHPGYESDDAQTSFQVKISRPGRASYGENPKCPHCHPAYLNPGTCEPCIVKR